MYNNNFCSEKAEDYEHKETGGGLVSGLHKALISIKDMKSPKN